MRYRNGVGWSLAVIAAGIVLMNTNTESRPRDGTDASITAAALIPASDGPVVRVDQVAPDFKIVYTRTELGELKVHAILSDSKPNAAGPVASPMIKPHRSTRPHDAPNLIRVAPDLWTNPYVANHVDPIKPTSVLASRGGRGFL